MAAAAALPMAPAAVKGKVDAAVAKGQTGLSTPRVSSAGAQAPAQQQAVAKVNHLQNLVLFPLVSVAGLQFKHSQEHVHPSLAELFFQCPLTAACVVTSRNLIFLESC